MNLIHIGLQRTGNTTLQNAVFAWQDGFFYIGKRDDRYLDPETKELMDRISVPDSVGYEPEATKHVLEAICSRNTDAKPLFIADEILGLEGRADRRVIAQRLFSLFAPAKVLIIVRAQTTIVQALYFKHLSALGERIVPFDEWLERNYGVIEYTELYRLGLNYEPLVRAYEEVFGADNVVVLPSELMHVEGSIFARGLAELLRVPVQTVEDWLVPNVTDQSISRRHAFAHRLQNMLPMETNFALLGRRFLPAPLYQNIKNLVAGGARVETPVVSEQWRSRIGAICAKGNAQLEERRGLPLRSLGYPSIAKTED